MARVSFQSNATSRSSALTGITTAAVGQGVGDQVVHGVDVVHQCLLHCGTVAGAEPAERDAAELGRDPSAHSELEVDVRLVHELVPHNLGNQACDQRARREGDHAPHRVAVHDRPQQFDRQQVDRHERGQRGDRGNSLQRHSGRDPATHGAQHGVQTVMISGHGWATRSGLTANTAIRVATASTAALARNAVA